MSKMIPLNEQQRRMVEQNLFVVRKAIHSQIIVNENIYGFEYDDLFQEGCIWLCKAAVGFCPDKNVKFSTYAEKVVTNGLKTYCRITCRKQKRLLTVPIHTDADDEFALDQLPSEDDWDQIISEMDTMQLLRSVKQQYSGVARLGIEAIEWKVKGLSGAEIAKMYGVKPNVVGAWISRAVQKLEKNDMFMLYMGKVVEDNAA